MIFKIIVWLIALYIIYKFFKIPYDIKGEEDAWRKELGLDN